MSRMAMYLVGVVMFSVGLVYAHDPATLSLMDSERIIQWL